MMSRFKKCAMNLLPLRIGAFCMAAVLPWLSYAETETIDGFRWCYRSVEDGVEITSPIDVGEEEDSSWWDGRSLTVPERLGGNPVVSIGDNAFAGGSFAAISLPNTVTKIGGRAFANCSSLVSVDLSDRLTYIGWGAFSHTGISSIDIPPGVTDILFDTFASCASLSSVTFHDDIKSIQSGAFRECGLRSVMLPKNLEYLAQDAFSDDYIEEVTVFSKLRTLDFSAFRHTQVGRITIPDSDVSICWTGTGDDWTMISSVTIPWSKVQALLDALTIKCDYADGTSSTFWYGPQTLEISDTVEEIPDGMFIGNGSIEHFVWPKGLRRIGKSAFEHCWNMTQAHLPKTLEIIDDYAFRGCNCFGCPNLRSNDVVLQNTVVIPASVKYIGRQVFHPTVIDANLSGDSITMVKFFFEGLPPSCHPEAFTNYVCSGSQWESTAGYYLPEYESEWLSVIDAKGEFCGLPMHRASTFYEIANGIRWPYYVEDGRAVIGFYDGIASPDWHLLDGCTGDALDGDIAIPSVLGGFPVEKIDSGVLRWQGSLKSMTIPASVSELKEETINDATMSFPRVRFGGLPPKNFEKAFLLQRSGLLEYPLSRESEWLAFLAEKKLTIKAVSYDDTATPAVLPVIAKAADVSATYDGAAHGISVSVKSPTSGVTVEYARSQDGLWQAEALTFTDVCAATKVWYRALADGYLGVTNAATVTVSPRPISNATLTLVGIPEEGYKYDGAAKEPAVSLADTLAGFSSSDYAVTYVDNVNAGTAKAVITGVGNYTGTVEVAFSIAPRSLTFTSANCEWEYDGAEHSCTTTPDISGDGFVGADNVIFSDFASVVSLGRYENTFSYAFTKGTVASNYSVTKVYGSLLVSDFKMTIKDDGTVRIDGFGDEPPGSAELVIPERICGIPVTEIGAGAFANLKWGVTKLILPRYLKKIGASAFRAMRTLREIVFQPVYEMDDVTPATLDVGTYAFASTGLETLAVPDYVREIGGYAFANCGSLKRVAVAAGTTVSAKAFYRSGITAGKKPEVLSLGAFTVSGSVATMEVTGTGGTIDVSGLKVCYATSLAADATWTALEYRTGETVLTETGCKVTVTVDVPADVTGGVFFRAELAE